MIVLISFVKRRKKKEEKKKEKLNLYMIKVQNLATTWQAGKSQGQVPYS